MRGMIFRKIEHAPGQRQLKAAKRRDRRHPDKDADEHKRWDGNEEETRHRAHSMRNVSVRRSFAAWRAGQTPAASVARKISARLTAIVQVGNAQRSVHPKDCRLMT